MANFHSTTVKAVEGPVPSPVERIHGDVMLVSLACGHTLFGNPSMHFKPGDRAKCWDDEHQRV